MSGATRVLVVLLAAALAHAGDAWQGDGLTAGTELGANTLWAQVEGMAAGRSLPEPHLPHPLELGVGSGRTLLAADLGIYRHAYPKVIEYLEAMAKQPTVDCAEAVKNQSLPTSADLWLEPWDAMKDVETVDARIAFLNTLHDMMCTNTSGQPGANANLRVAVFTMWSGDLWNLRRTLLPFMQWHTHIGVCRFYVAYPGRDQPTVDALKRVKSVRLIFSQPPFASKTMVARWREYAAQDAWAQRPGNWRQMAKQCFTGNIACQEALREDINWLFHLDADELLLPAQTLAADLAAVPSWVAGLTVFNHEAIVEVMDVVNKYEQVTLFKNHGKHGLVNNAHLMYHGRTGTHDSFYKGYYNGKGAARVDHGSVTLNGIHTFRGSNNSAWVHPIHNPKGEFITLELNTTALLHLSYTKWHDLTGKANRACPPEFKDAALAHDYKKVQDCFVLPFDRDAYVAAVQGEESARQFWIQNCLLSEGAVRGDGESCHVYRDVHRWKELLIQFKFARRVNVVQQTLRAHELAISNVAKSMGVNMALVV